MEGLKAQRDFCAQIVTLATALLAFTVTFVEKFGDATQGTRTTPHYLQWGWVAYVLAILFAIWAIMAIVGTMTVVESGTNPNPSRSNVRLPAALMILAFLAAIVLTVLAGWQLTT